MRGVRVREATVVDAEAVALVHVRAWQVGYAGILPDDVLAALDPVERTEQRRAYLADPQRVSTVLVVELAGEVVGFADAGPYRIDQDRERLDPDAGELYALYVHPERWGAGAGRALMDAALSHLGASGPRPVRLWVLTANTPARRFYERCGFAADGAVATFATQRPNGATIELAEVRYVRAVARNPATA